MVPAPSLNAPLTAILTGPTASGKSDLAHTFAREHGGIDIINGDSVCVYKGMDIGSAKPTRDEQAEVHYHLLDVHSPSEPFTAGDFVRGVNSAIADIHGRGKRALIVGGTGFYLKALTHGLWGEGAEMTPHPEVRHQIESHSNSALYAELYERDPDSAARIGPNDRYRLIRAMEIMTLTGKTPSELQAARPRPRQDLALFLIDRPAPEIQTRIRSRIQKMLAQGLIDEVRALEASFPQAAALKAVGYTEVLDFLHQRTPQGRKLRPGLDGLQDEIELSTRQLVKRQRTFFRGSAFREGLTLKEYLLDRDRERLLEDLKAFYA